MPREPSPDIHADRIAALNDAEEKADGAYVLYVMEASMRSRMNHALELAAQHANRLGKRLLVLYPLVGDTFGAHRRQKHFMLQGVGPLRDKLTARRIRFAVVEGGMAETALRYAEDACRVVLDAGYLRDHRAWRDEVGNEAEVPVEEVESDVVVPVGTASDKKEHAARTIRPKIHKRLDDFLVALEPTELEKDATTMGIPDDEVDLSSDAKIGEALDRLGFGEGGVPPVPLFRGGEDAGEEMLERFLSTANGVYSDHRNQPQTDDVSHMSKYLHFGNLSPIRIALAARDKLSGDDRDDFLEELIVRRELTHNFVHFEEDYDKFSQLPAFARETLDEHRDDEREHVYTRQQLEDADTHDPYWNAAQRELVHTGYMHNYMRMYWGKKILEWTNTPEYGFETTLYLNNKYFLDGRDPNSFANVAWVYGQHDRGWTEREIFGKVRYMNRNGLERKAKPKAYVEKVDRLVEEAEQRRVG
ncbi:deoxyribodipyrimidine photo-lyase [Phycisphaera mikurensis]|uniref:Deoxyribodipyrimidine photo-lyase n=1 Tax=Phycisphaera mikurensis (strain NBRC 102666 / KCTC 22515 / FYK2301M01) TaxID=1142394 RepID=I0IBG6_PHYMF|nr:deoxyribodipyrimidine photo-lyase [Phycisphaera mikurensis]MBB6442863.1 deoxyribodipyrimidine photo-lyase [Phycisphaera mikurensis]BAM02604.1 deoxyribodipyrimidine photo-lyase [Phycisphaera mikurensis NBRC 102666]